MTKRIFPLFLLIFTLCKAQNQDSLCLDNLYETRLFINGLLNKLNKEDVEIYNEVLKELSINDVALNDLFSDEYFSLLKNFDIKSEKDVIHFDELFDKVEYDYLKKQLKCYNSNSWLEFTNNSKFISKKQKNHKKKFSCSIPVFTPDKQYAFLYIETQFSGDLRVYKKATDGQWTYFAQVLVWID